MIDIWKGCYDIGWGKNLVLEAFSHPAKVSFSLAGKIYNHAINMGWVKRGDYCLDPFAGIAGFGFHALCYGLNWIGVELESKFVSLGQQNIELWNRQLKGWPNLGTARIIRGDSRKLKEMIEKADLVISSPPFMEGKATSGGPTAGWKKRLRGKGDGDLLKGSRPPGYGHTPGNLANLKEGNIDLVVSSPPYAESINSKGSGIDWSKRKDANHRTNPTGDGSVIRAEELAGNYGHSPGQLGSMKEGSIDAVIGSPPYSQEGLGHRGKPSEIDIKKALHGRINNAEYGQTEGNLGNLKEGSFDIAISSPPWEKQMQQDKGSLLTKWCEQHDRNPDAMSRKQIYDAYGKTDGQLGNSSGDTFWEASKEIVQQCYELLKPGGHAIWVTKAYCKKGAIVDFPGRWKALCESVGFKTVCEHQASLVKKYGTQIKTNGEDEYIEVSRKSFFRRLHETKRPDLKIDWEMVQCMIKE